MIGHLTPDLVGDRRARHAPFLLLRPAHIPMVAQAGQPSGWPVPTSR
ncbi:ash family protein [Dickeya oryzae]|nr:ash family protein [Dickeya oryzae]